MLLTTSLYYQHCHSTKDTTEVFLFKSICIPSMKTKVVSADESNDTEEDGYQLFMVFDASGGEVLPYPFTCCGCYDGRTFCSHLLAQLLAFWQIQRCNSWAAFVEIWPPLPTPTQGIPTLFENLVAPELESRNIGQQERNKEQESN